MLLKIVRGVGPWVLFSLILHFGSLQLINLAWISFFLLQTWVGWPYLKAGNPLSWCSTLLFAALFANSYWQWWWPGILYAASWCYGAFTLTTLVTVLIGRPFTLTHARLHTPAEFWHHPIFLRINQHLALAWAASFCLNGLVMLWAHLYAWPSLITSYVVLAATIAFTDKYPAYYRAKAQASRQAPESSPASTLSSKMETPV